MLVAPPPPPALRDRDRDGRVLVQPWNLDKDEYIAHAFDQLRQDSVTQPEVDLQRLEADDR